MTSNSPISNKISNQMNDLFGREDEERITRIGGRERSVTHELAKVCRDIVEHWDALPDTLKKRIRSRFVLDETTRPIKISLL